MEVKNGIYQHFKGHKYRVIGVARHSETLEEFVTYKHIDGKRKDESHYWVRPIRMFLEDVEVDGVKVPRFKYLGE